MFMQTGDEEDIEMAGRNPCPNCGKDNAMMDMDIDDIVLQNNINYGIEWQREE